MAPLTVTSQNFQTDVVESSVPVLIDLWAPWCGPCLAVAPVLQEMADAYDGRLKIAKINVDDEPQLAAQFGVRGIPTMLLMQQGEVVKTMVGAGPRPTIERELGIADAVAGGAAS
jgi:thioredoxin 1